MRSFHVRLAFHGDLNFFLRPNSNQRIERTLFERTSIKDVIESCGVPHPEVDFILIDGEAVDFSHVVARDADVEVYPVNRNYHTFFTEKRLQARQIQMFVADGHLGTLVRDLRLLGFDVLYNRAAEDRQLIAAATRNNRALLTRDRRLLMHAVVQHGYCPRSDEPLEQTIEVLHRFDLAAALVPFSRCLRCNARLERVEKAVVLEQLEPLTKLYYNEFRRCAACGQLYWRGSHFSKLQARVAQLRQRL